MALLKMFHISNCCHIHIGLEGPLLNELVILLNTLFLSTLACHSFTPFTRSFYTRVKYLLISKMVLSSGMYLLGRDLLLGNKELF